MRIAVIGAGFAGLGTAKVLRDFDHDVTVFEKAPDVGGVWSATRRYPGLRTQNDKGTYAFSELPMPRDYPEWPAGEQVQRYLELYVERFALAPSLRLSTEVTRAALREDGTGWDVTAGGSTEPFDHLVVANGIFSEPFIPPFKGVEVLEAAGGRILAASGFRDLVDAVGKHVVVVGYGKSACDVAVEIAGVAATTTVVARGLLWKTPRRIGGLLNYKYLLLTRLGEGMFRYIAPTAPERFLHGGGDGLRRAMIRGVQAVASRQYRLPALGLVPGGSFEDIACSTVGLVTEGFFEAVAEGRVKVARDTTIARLLEKDGAPYAELADGSLVPSDLIVCATGFRQQVPFLDEDVQRRLTDERGNFALYRHILPHDVPNLTFAGYNSSFFSPLSAEMSAVWIASHLAGLHTVPPAEERRRAVSERLAWMEERTRGRHARGTNVIPFSMHNIDEVLDDLDLNVSGTTKALQWLLPVDPGDYRHVGEKLRQRLRQTAP
ncbi:NAD(P)/FAD-dependent oxidoreductase [Actinocorallia libanotica]|uniref:NAD(P)/FAD-dependent oxidoreductase n=1 Tax=Actinocorallia libanotica TaxID=46162 RepID=A0ABN1RLZ1_9ACTN